MSVCLCTHNWSVHLWDLSVHPCTTLSFGRHVKVCMDHDLTLKANLLLCGSCFEKELGSQVQQDIPYHQNHSVMYSKEIYHNRQFSDQSAQWGLYAKHLLYCWVISPSTQKNCIQRNHLAMKGTFMGAFCYSKHSGQY